MRNPHLSPRRVDQSNSGRRPSSASHSRLDGGHAGPVQDTIDPTAGRCARATRVAAFLAATGWLLTGCPHPVPHREIARPGKPRAVNLQFAAGDVLQYQGKLVFAARVDLWGGSSKMSRRIWARFELRRTVTKKTKQRTCFEDHFFNPRMGLGTEPVAGHKPPPHMRRNPGIVSVETELANMTVSWCLKPSGGLADFSVEGAGRNLANLRIEQVLHRIYQLAVDASVAGKPIGSTWKTTSRINTKMADAAMLVDLETDYACAVPTTCAIDERPPAEPGSPDPALSGPPKTAQAATGATPKDARAATPSAPPAAAARTSESASSPPINPNRPACLELTGKERGIIPDFDLKREGKTYKMGGVIKGRMRIIVDQTKATWRSWRIQRIMGIAASTKTEKGEATLGMRYDTTFLLRLTNFIPKTTLRRGSHH
ncbi:MAG: hypothetical protein J7M25_13430 [Deltaproteobacteria bacterium]|nr:hypothetical protein [Deltaproteobacteria bacterium]